MSQSKSDIYCIVAIIFFTVLAYGNSFTGAFIFDDTLNILHNRFITLSSLTFSNLTNVISESWSKSRPLPNLTFALNYYFHGQDTWGYHLFNLAIHTCTAVILFFVCTTTLSLSSLSDKYPKQTEIAFIAALLWAVHPIQTNGVTYIVQRMTSMCTLFYLLSLLLYIFARLNKGRRVKQIFQYGLSVVFGILALLSKEIALFLPITIIVYDFYFIQENRRSILDKNRLLLLLGCALLILIAALFFLGIDFPATLLKGYEFRDFTLYERLLTQSRIIFFYISLLAFPLPSRLNFNHDIIISESLLAPPQTVLAVVGIFFLLALIFFLFNRNRLISFALFWFLGNLLIESTIIPLELIFEHRLYLPSTMVLLAVVATMYSLCRSRLHMVRLITCLMISCCIFWTWQRNTIWQSKISLWTDVVRKSPGLARAHVNLGNALLNQNFREAEKHFLQAIALDKEFSMAYSNLGVLYIKQNRPQEALVVLNTALTAKTKRNTPVIYRNIGIAYRKIGNFQAAKHFLRKVLENDPDDLEALVNLGVCFEKTGEHEKADNYFREAERKGADSVSLYNNWGITKHSLGQVDAAILLLQKAIQLEPNHIEAHYNLGVAYGTKGMIPEAKSEMNRSIRLRMEAKSGVRSTNQ